MLYYKYLLENHNDPNNYNELLNRNIRCDEIEKMINGANLKKVCEFYGIYNEVLKNNECKHVLYRFFNLCFEYGKVPSVWQKAIISPVPKSAKKESHVPSRSVFALMCKQKLFLSSKQPYSKLLLEH